MASNLLPAIAETFYFKMWFYFNLILIFILKCALVITRALCYDYKINKAKCTTNRFYCNVTKNKSLPIEDVCRSYTKKI
jgi:hypothetical protein